MPSNDTDQHRWVMDILRHITMAEEFAGVMDFNAFSDDTLRVYAVTRCLEIISEASRRLPDDLKARHPHISWRQMAAAGNVYRHEYEDVLARLVWQTLTDHLPPLRAAIEAELGGS
jgi:uncharacterized protein with HEPN domain